MSDSPPNGTQAKIQSWIAGVAILLVLVGIGWQYGEQAKSLARAVADADSKQARTEQALRILWLDYYGKELPK